MQIYLHWPVPPGEAGRHWSPGHDGRNWRCKPDSLHRRGVNRISDGGKTTQKPRTARHALQKQGTAPRSCTGRGRESATVSRQIDSLSREERARDTGRMAVEPRARFLLWGKCYGFAANRFTFPFPQEYDIALANAIYENSRSNRKLLNLYKTL